jgi:urease accessory protein UreE
MFSCAGLVVDVCAPLMGLNILVDHINTQHMERHLLFTCFTAGNQHMPCPATNGYDHGPNQTTIQLLGSAGYTSCSLPLLPQAANEQYQSCTHSRREMGLFDV